MVFNHGDWIDQADEDSMSILILKGKQKSRAVEPEFKEALSHLGASGELFRSGAHAIAVMHRFKLARGLKVFKVSEVGVELHSRPTVIHPHCNALACVLRS